MNTKSALLTALESYKGQFVSGEDLARQIGCSRNAVWKAAKALRQEGYQLLSVPHRGYCLSSSSDQLSSEAVRAHLKQRNTDPRRIIVLNTVSSTNTYLDSHRRDLPEGSMVLANEQTQGRGHYRHAFSSPAGCGLYMSLLLRESAHAIGLRKLTMLLAVSVCRAVQKLYDISLSIKWINDLYAPLENGEWRKIGGILTEASKDIETDDTEEVIVGLGLNVTTPKGGYPEPLRGIAASLEELSQCATAFSRSHLAAEVSNQMFDALQEPWEDVSREYISRSMLPGREVLIRSRDGGRQTNQLQQSETDDVIRARVLAVTPDGDLNILSSGKEQIIHQCEVHLA